MAGSAERTVTDQAKDTLASRYRDVRRRIDEAAARVGRNGREVVLVAVTKNASIDRIRGLIELGHVDLGENRVQHLLQRAAQVEEFLDRHRELGGGRRNAPPESVRWHMIGHLQRNKVKKIIDLVRLIHSVDSLRLVEEIHNATASREEPVEVLVQVNVAREKSKFGVAPPAARHLVEQIDTMLGLRPRGLMCMAPHAEDPEAARPVFERAAELFEEIRKAGVGGERFNILSMGMSHDFEVAVECGANVVRVGSAIFGEPSAEALDGAEAG